MENINKERIVMKKEIKEFCEKHNITIDQFYGKNKIEGNLDLRLATSIPEGFNPIVGGNLYLPNNLKAQKTDLPENYLFSWQNEKYIQTDGIFTEVVSKRGNVYRVKQINKDKVFYLITDGEKWSHGDTLKEAKADLLFKISNHRKKEDFKHLTLKDKISFEDGIMAYRVITGACSFGVKNFVNNRLQKKKSKYTISEIIDLTTNEYGNKEFQRFFAA